MSCRRSPQRDATPERLAAALARLIGDTPERQAQLAAFARLDAVMAIGTARPSEAAADIVIRFAHARGLIACGHPMSGVRTPCRGGQRHCDFG